jgi:hypothetical protein
MQEKIPDLPASFRTLLNFYGFDWESGRIILQNTQVTCSPGQMDWSGVRGTIEISKEDPRLDLCPKKGFPGKQMLRFVAFDHRAIYFPWAFECVDMMKVVFKDPEAYLTEKYHLTPYATNWNEGCPTLHAARMATGYFRRSPDRK